MPLHRLWLLAFVGFVLTIGAWSLITPYDGSPDEMAHTLRAYAVVSGDIAPKPADASLGTGAFEMGPKNLYRGNCWASHPEISAACAGDTRGPHTLVRVGNSAGRYNPVYYAIVGLPIKIWPSMKGVILARLISAVMGAALLAASLVSVVRYSRHRLVLGALLFAASPMAICMSGVINPNGVEITAGIAFFAAGIPLLIGRARERPPTWLVCVTVISAVILVTVRSGGPAWLAIAALALLLPLRLRTVQQILRSVAMRWGILVVAVAGIASALWIVVMKSSALGALPREGGLLPSQIFLVELERWPDITRQMVGVLGWLDTPMWGPAYLLWEYPVGALLLVALLVGSGLDRLRLLVVTCGTVAIAAIVEMAGANQHGFVNQGRYLLPMLSGAVLLAAWIIEARGAVTPARARLITRFAVVVTLPIQLHALQVAMARYQHGIGLTPVISDYNPFAGDWRPKVGSVLPFAVAVAGLVVLGVLCWRLAAVPAGLDPQDADELATAESPDAARAHGSGRLEMPAGAVEQASGPSW